MYSKAISAFAKFKRTGNIVTASLSRDNVTKSIMSPR
jgi:hypothetical protein